MSVIRFLKGALVAIDAIGYVLRAFKRDDEESVPDDVARCCVDSGLAVYAAQPEPDVVPDVVPVPRPAPPGKPKGKGK